MAAIACDPALYVKYKKKWRDDGSSQILCRDLLSEGYREFEELTEVNQKKVHGKPILYDSFKFVGKQI